MMQTARWKIRAFSIIASAASDLAFIDAYQEVQTHHPLSKGGRVPIVPPMPAIAKLFISPPVRPGITAESTQDCGGAGRQTLAASRSGASGVPLQ